ncbi:MAG: TonB-dependent receptor [Methyloglobulus sp.]|nr:TonB-dependent receptor [Methyloglobulus sp.]
MQFAADSHLELMFTAEKIRGLRTDSLDGDMTPSQALSRLLQSSGMTYRFVDAKTVTVEPAPSNFKKTAVVDEKPEPQSNNETGSDTTLPKVTVEADADNPYDDPTWQTDPYNTDYVLPKATAGTKTNTPIMETPLNVQVISKQVLKDQQVIRLKDALKNVSGVIGSSYDGSSNSLFLRGFETNTFFRNGFRLDNPSGYSRGLTSRQFANVESVEVLKGASAILYGRVEPGGMVNVTTKQPLATPYYALQQQFGSYGLYRTSLDASGPLTKDDTLLYRMNMSYESKKSFRDLVDDENIFLAPIIKWNISPTTQATLEMEYQKNTAAAPDFGIVPLFKGKILDFPRSRNYFDVNPNHEETIFLGFNWSHQFNDDWSIKHRFSMNKVNNLQGLGQYASQVHYVDGRPVLDVPGGGGDINLDTYSTGIDLTGHFNTGPLKHTLLFGGDYYKYDVNFISLAFGNSEIDFLNPIHPATPAKRDPANDYNAQNVIDNYGLYFQDQIELPYHIHVMGGIRYQYVHSQFNIQYPNVKGQDSALEPPLTADAVTPRVGILWQPQKWFSVYGNYVEGFGVNSGQTYPDRKSVPPTSAEQWEIGAKTELFDGRFRATLAYYDLTKTNIATGHPNPVLAAQGFSKVTGAARSRGPEIDIQGEILPGWNVIATYTNTDARITKSNNGDLGDRFYNVPRNMGTVWTTYEFQKGLLNGLKLGGGVTMQDSLVGGFDRTSQARIPGFATVNMMAGYSFSVGKSKITAQLNIDNLLDKTYYSGGANYSSYYGSPSGYSWNYRGFGTPRTFMGSINVEY